MKACDEKKVAEKEKGEDKKQSVMDKKKEKEEYEIKNGYVAY
jgi:hypothetical protein